VEVQGKDFRNAIAWVSRCFLVQSSGGCAGVCAPKLPGAAFQPFFFFFSHGDILKNVDLRRGDRASYTRVPNVTIRTPEERYNAILCTALSKRRFAR
jgi:hypothetical protein